VPVPGAAETVRRLQREDIPHIFLTNGSGTTEGQKAASLSRILGLAPEHFIQAEQMQLASTPMRGLVEEYKEKLVLFIGKDHVRDVADEYGFQNAVTSEEYHAQFPTLYPDIKVDPVPPVNKWRKPVSAVFVLADPIPWGRDIQLICDLAASDGNLSQRVSMQRIPVYFSTPDFEYVGEHHLPRLGNGSFMHAAKGIYEELAGKPLKSTIFGKPYKISYEYATENLERMATSTRKTLDVIYGVGDNPLTDIRGANAAGGKWRSVLTRTGIFQGGENDEKNPAHHVVEDLLEWFELAQENARRVQKSS